LPRAGLMGGRERALLLVQTFKVAGSGFFKVRNSPGFLKKAGFTSRRAGICLRWPSAWHARAPSGNFSATPWTKSSRRDGYLMRSPRTQVKGVRGAVSCLDHALAPHPAALTSHAPACLCRDRRRSGRKQCTSVLAAAGHAGRHGGGGGRGRAGGGGDRRWAQDRRVRVWVSTLGQLL
jgi:hypothetical protein